MMNTNYRDQLNMPLLKNLLGVESLKRNLNAKQLKAVKNFKYCANDQWAWVNSWLDDRDQNARQYMMDARELYNTIYSDALVNVYGEGYVCFNRSAEAYLKDIRFCGKTFLKKLAFYFTAKLLEDSVPEVEGTEEDSEKVIRDLKELKAELNIA